MRTCPIAHNQRKCKCADCKKELPAGEGIQHSYPMFHGKGQFYYCCPPCDAAREVTERKIVDQLKDKTHG